MKKSSYMVVYKIYDENTKTQKVWYDSTMFCFTKAVEHENENKVELFVTFKNGWTYNYKDVKMEDYVLLLSGFEQSSHGKTLNKVIKPNYEFERVKDENVDAIWEECNKLMEKEREKTIDINKTYFISGHRDITNEEFEINYQPVLNNVVSEVEDCLFVVGDYQGVDIMAQNYLIEVLQVDPSRITVYHMLEKPRNINEKIKNTIGGFKTDEERDKAMTNASFEDIAFVRDNTKISGTAQNILRRYLLNK